MLERIENSLKKLEKPVKLSVIAAIFGGIIFALAIVSNMATGAAPTVSPLDVNVTNTPNVSVVNTPTVNIGAGNNVGITGTPNVNVANTITNPVLVRDVDNPARQPFQIQTGIIIPDNTVSTCSSFSVPSGKELVIEFVSARSSLPSGEKIEIDFSPTVNGTVANYFLIPNLEGTFGSNDDFVASQQMRVYADPGSIVGFCAGRPINSISGQAETDLAFSGYLVNTTS